MMMKFEEEGGGESTGESTGVYTGMYTGDDDLT